MTDLRIQTNVAVIRADAAYAGAGQWRLTLRSPAEIPLDATVAGRTLELDTIESQYSVLVTPPLDIAAQHPSRVETFVTALLDGVDTADRAMVRHGIGPTAQMVDGVAEVMQRGTRFLLQSSGGGLIEFRRTPAKDTAYVESRVSSACARLTSAAAAMSPRGSTVRLTSVQVISVRKLDSSPAGRIVVRLLWKFAGSITDRQSAALL